MKGSKLPKLAALLLVLTLATTCFVSGTFAKYVSEGEGKDAARVAKWGVKVEITGDGFKTTYGKDEVNANVDGPPSSPPPQTRWSPPARRAPSAA